LTLSQPELERLRAQIREVVIAVLRKREAAPVVLPGGKSVIVLFTGNAMPADDFFAQVATLAGQGYTVVAALGRTFEQFNGEKVMERLPKGAVQLDRRCEVRQREAARTAEALVAPSLSTNSAGKIALGLEDNVASRLVRAMLAAGKPVCVGMDLPGHRQLLAEQAPGMPPAMVRVAEDHLHMVQQMGVRFAAGNLANCLTTILTPEVNETPDRLARNKPSPKREFITAEDVWNALAAGKKELLHSPSAIITDEAREYAAMRGVALKSR
jgi:hypothetical protein